MSTIDILSDEWALLHQLAESINASRTKLELVKSKNYLNENAFFTLLMALFVFLMQCGFAFLEAGSVRGKNCTNILAKNLLDSLITIIGYWSVGWAFAYGSNPDAEMTPFIGLSNFFGEGISSYARFFFQYVFAARASTIISGAVAERCEFVTFLAYSLLMSSVVYPILTHWGWSQHGWLKAGIDLPGVNSVTYLDIAGSGVVHLCGGTISIIAAYLMGPRIGRFSNSAQNQPILGHSVPLAALGGFILMAGFLAFNGSAIADITVHGAGQNVAKSMINTILCGAFSALFYLFFYFQQNGKWTVLLTINACLTGMISSCAGCSILPSWSAIFIGFGAALIYLTFSKLLVRLQIDDPLDAFAVHAGGGLWGLIAVCIFYPDGIVSAILGDAEILHALWQLGWNIVCAAVIIVWSTLTMFPVFLLLKASNKFRVSPEVEERGLDYFKHGESAYPIDAYGHGWVSSPKVSLMGRPMLHKLDKDLTSLGEIQNDNWTTIYHDPASYDNVYPDVLRNRNTKTNNM